MAMAISQSLSETTVEGRVAKITPKITRSELARIFAAQKSVRFLIPIVGLD